MFPRRALTEETPTALLKRVAYQLILRHHREHPARFTHPPSGIYDLFEELRTTWPNVAWYVRYASYASANGERLAAWRDRRETPGPRALYKRRTPRS